MSLTIGGLETFAHQAERPLNAKADAFLKQYPKTESNAIAQKLNQALIELKLAPVELWPAQIDISWSIETEIDGYLWQQFEQTSGSLQPLPSGLQSYLNTHRAKLQRTQDLLLGSELPIWMLDVQAAANVEHLYLNFRGVSQLHRLFILQAIAADRQSQRTDRENALSAAWKLQEALAQHPLARTITPSMVRSQLGIMRYMDGLAPTWQTRASHIAKPSQMLETLQLNNWLTYRGISSSQDPQKLMDIIGRQLLIDFRFTPPSLFRLQNVDVTERLDSAYQTLATQNRCKADASDLVLSMSWWNTFKKALWIGDSASAAETMALISEFTQKILQLKAIAAQRGQWPSTLTDSTSNVCDGVRWQYTTADDAMSLSMENPPPMKEGRTTVIKETQLPYIYSDHL
ncbi:MAG: hypothetical protein WCD18_22050 [Thermosynechococcaceae cyanobacterium]